MSTSWLTLHEVAERFRVTRATIWAWRRRGAFPAPVVLPRGRSVRWDSREVEAFERKLRAARTEAAA